MMLNSTSLCFLFASFVRNLWVFADRIVPIETTLDDKDDILSRMDDAGHDKRRRLVLILIRNT